MIRQAKTENGIVQCAFGYDPRVSDFLGIPYAAPPVGELRWRNPQPAKDWDGVLVCDKYKSIAWQPVPGGDPKEFWTKEIHPTGTEFPMNEDCLYLNVYTCAETPDDKLPVLYYIHGGGLRGGYPYEVEFDWEHMAKKGIVVVTVAYRLGVFGFMAHPELRAEAPNEPQGNYGTMDQLAGLKWVKRNIAAFGGDPDKITIAGQSAGSFSVQCLLTSPLSEGCFNGAVIQSGIWLNLKDMNDSERCIPKDVAEETGVRFLEEQGIHSIAEARKVDAKQLMDYMVSGFKGGGRMPFQPELDGIYLKESPSDAYANGRHHDVPVIAGYNYGESRGGMMRMGSRFPQTIAALEEFADRYGDKKADFLKTVDCKTDDDVKELFNDDAFVRLIASTFSFGMLMNKLGRKAYLYEFAADIPGDDNAGSYHGSELWFAYDALGRCWRPFTGKHYDLARQVSSYWVNFVKTGDPNGKDTFGYDLPEWKAFDDKDEFMIRFEDVPVKREGKVSEALKFRFNNCL